MSKSSSNRFTDVYIQIGIKISYYRKLRGYSQAQLAEKANMSSGFLSQVEAPGMAVAISLEKLLSIAEALQIPPAKLLEFEEIWEKSSFREKLIQEESSMIVKLIVLELLQKRAVIYP